MLKATDYSKPVNRGVQILLAVPMAFCGILAAGVGMLIFYFGIVEKDVPGKVIYAGALFLPVVNRRRDRLLQAGLAPGKRIHYKDACGTEWKKWTTFSGFPG